MSRRSKRERKNFQKSLHNGISSVTSPRAGDTAPASPLAAVGSTDHGPSLSTRSVHAAVYVFAADAPYPQVLDEDGRPIYVTEADARALMLKGRATFIRKSKHLKGIRIIPTLVREPQTPGSLRGKTLGDSHAGESRDNPIGVWTIEHCGRKPSDSRSFRSLPRWADRELFSRPVVDCLSTRAA